MKVVVISDTHNRHAEIHLPFGDVLVHCGDATGGGTPGEVGAFVTWFEKQDYEHKIMIAGNHDWLFQDDPFLAKTLVDGRDFHYLQDSGIEIQGVKFYGSPWQPWFCDWAFNLKRGPELAAKWAMIPDDTEFLITHGPPKDILDYIPPQNERPGCLDLLQRVAEIKPAVHAFGHIHEGYGYLRVSLPKEIGKAVTGNSNTLFVNASTCTREYVPTNKPIVLQRYDYARERVWDVVP